MASIIIGSVPIHGHVTPLLAVARHLVDRGDSVRFITGARFAEQVAATGATHLVLPEEADYDDRTLGDVTFPERAALKGTKAIAWDIENVFVRPGRAQYEAALEAHAAEPADVVIVEPAFAGGAYLTSLPRQQRPAVMVGGVLPLSLSSVDTAPFGMGLQPAPVLNRLRNRLLAAAGARLFAPAEAVAQRVHHEIHGRPMPGQVLDWGRRADAIAQFTVEEFEYPRSDAPEHLAFLGPVSATGSTAPLPEWWSELDGGRPVVHVTQGTIANEDFTQLVAPLLEGLADDDVTVVVATGGRPLASLPPLPANARAAEYLPYDELLPKTHVFVTNGGYGGVQYALKYGVPIVVTGGKEDKPEVGARVAWSGVGRRFRAERPSPRALRRAVRRVLRDPGYRRRAGHIADRMAAAPGLPGLAGLVDELAGARLRR